MKQRSYVEPQHASLVKTSSPSAKQTNLDPGVQHTGRE
eukprot:CAMPEP_0177387034 /NCGR_PEP_ID=MMETSP0368-20130122/51136_1 /TAXON_ID=447022 ORGANISM="Scrippsiella hangoei-like, Strain SHHI-4" /NCGR_SAMPLE_ID=MMETSP0368 /ASSEMBLY_ACC=CAM_ASM_000363 /LENGTH=37 /DNA_ID= /DNA_START= /DNA_END= /DNA_ORIENTATION=